MDGDSQKGIQALLQAEQEASEVVAKARKSRTARVKQAVEEAHAEIKLYKEQREDGFKKYAQEHLGETGDRKKKLEAETEKAIVKIKNDSLAKRNDVIQVLVQNVISVDTSIPTKIGA